MSGLLKRRFCIVGLGLLGGTYAMCLKHLGCRVTAVDIDEKAICWAKEHGVIDEGTAGAPEALLSGADVVVLGLYPGAMVEWVRAYAAHLRPGTLLTDVCGVKGAVVGPVQALLPPGVEFIACHPMAGREVGGVWNADPAIFRGANFLITPTGANTPGAVAFARGLGQALGFARISVLSCEEHDKVIGYVSQLTHAIAVSLMNANADEHLVDYTGDSFRDLTRIANINETLWSELFFANKSALIEEIGQFERSLNDVKRALETGDEEALKALMRQSAARRRLFEKNK